MKQTFSFITALAFATLTIFSCKKDDGNGSSNPASAGYKDDNTYSRLEKSISMLALQPDGKVLAAAGDESITRFNKDGTIDNSFQVDPGIVSPAFVFSAMVVQPDGKVLIAANKASNQTGVGIVRLNADGTLDNSFTIPALRPTAGNNFATVNAILLLPNGDLLVGGDLSYVIGSTYYYHVVRLKSNGTIDAGFKSPLPFASSNNVTALANTSDGKVLMSGAFGLYAGNDPTYSLVKINPDNGTAQAGFNSINHLYYYYAGFGSDAGAGKIIEQPDGKFLIHSGFGGIGLTSTEAKNFPGLARINKDGSLDESFNPEKGGSIVLLTDGNMAYGTGSALLGETLPVFFGTMNSSGKISSPLSNLGYDEGNIGCILRISDNELIIGGMFYKGNNLYSCFRVKK